MLVCVIKIDLRLFAVSSLKEKRSIVKSLIEKTKHKFTVSIAEIGEHDVWQAAQLGLALVGNSRSLLEREMNKILDFLEAGGEVEIVSVVHEIWGY
ncbi:DUF503 family protein [Thermanaerosceptrum fracticalcis]|uniref:DUF503 family protein n=1 Tax=Thermanaerosceptrum fracticalcis TaxID=1712410 RepID=A0A7G6E6B1_THEFR|nr:DUF503 domain-containing protein [Thermanaerosceptrum fracticalcis]QNB47615.1 DUF503 family protein [Thermanaerosceptrum fracticalcis]